MSNRGRALFALTAILFGAPRVLPAQDPLEAGVLRLTLDEAVTRGLEASHLVDEVRARGEAAAAEADERRADRRPFVSAQAGYQRTNHVDEFGLFTPDGQFRVIYPDIPDNLRARLDVQWPVYTGGRQEALVRAAEIEADVFAVDEDAVRAELRLEVTRAYWRYVTAIQASRVVEEALIRTDAHLVDARNRVEAGLAGPNDVLTAEAQQARHHLLRIQADADRDNLEAELARLVGEPPGRRIQPASMPAELASLGGSAMVIEALAAEARDQRPERIALAERLRVAEARRDAAALGLKPTVALSGGVDYARPNPRIFPRRDTWEPSWDAGLSVSWPIADGGRTRAAMAETDAAVRAAAARLAEFDGRLDVEIRREVRELASTRAAIAAAEAGVRAAAEARRVTADRFEEGVATGTDVLVAEGALLQAELDRTEALIAARLVEARLARTLGR